MEIKIKWIKRKQMTHENTYRDDILIAKNLLTGSLKNRSIDNLETQKKSISMKNSQFFDYLHYAKLK